MKLDYHPKKPTRCPFWPNQPSLVCTYAQPPAPEAAAETGSGASITKRLGMPCMMQSEILVHESTSLHDDKKKYHPMQYTLERSNNKPKTHDKRKGKRKRKKKVRRRVHGRG